MEEKIDWFEKASQHQDDENNVQALFAIEKYLEQNPKRASAKLLKVSICRDLSNYELCFQVLNEIKSRNIKDLVFLKLYHIESGRVYESIGNFQKAINCYDKAIEISPNETLPYIFKGDCLANNGKRELARFEFLKATKLPGDSEEAFLNLALICRAESKYLEAKIYCEKALEIDPDYKSAIHCYKDILEAIRIKESL